MHAGVRAAGVYVLVRVCVRPRVVMLRTQVQRRA
jgi:hypothetical protein